MAIFSSKAKRIRYSCIFGMSFYLCVYVWFFWMYPMEQTGVTPWQSALIVVVAWLIFPIMQTFVFLILPIGLRLFKNMNIFFLPALAASLYVIMEWVQSWFMSGLTWAKLSVSQYRDLFFIQSVSLFGTYFSSFIIIFVNAAIAIYIIEKPHRRNALVFAAILLYFSNAYFGLFRLMRYDHMEQNGGGQKITAQIIQGNVSSYEKWEEAENSFDIYKSLLEKNSGAKPDICVFPETAIPASVQIGSPTYNRLQDLAADNDTAILTGIIYCDEIEEKRYNAIMAFEKNSGFVRPYGKRHLVPFGEYLPAEEILTSLFPFVSNISLFDSVLTPGDGANIMEINGIRYGGLVCFDSIFPELARQSVLAGADVLTIVTNDSWFRDSPAIYQHNAQTVLRAVENCRYVARAANTGVSSFISPTGRILRQSDVMRREALTEEIGIVKNLTIYTRFGDIILYLSCIYVGFCLVSQICHRLHRG